MLLALYANGVLRLWNLLDGRCIFKKKVGMSAAEDDGDNSEDVQDAVDEEKADIEAQRHLQTEQARKVLKQFEQLSMRAEQVQWEPTQGNQFAVLFSRVLEVYYVEQEEPLHSITFDNNQTSFSYVGNKQIVVSDDKGRLSVLYNIDQSSAVMRIVKTNFTRCKSVQASPDHRFVSVVTNNSIAVWGMEELKASFDKRPDDSLHKVEPTVEIPQN